MRQLDVAQQNILHHQSALTELKSELVENLLADHLALAGIEGIGAVRSGSFADRRPQRRLNESRLIIGAGFLKYFGGPIGIEMVDERSIEAHHQAFAGWHAGRLLQALSLNRQLVIRLQRIDKMNAFTQRFAGYFSEQR